MKTKEQKTESVERGVEDLKGSKTVLLVDFTGTSVNKLNNFRRTVRDAGGAFRVIKKRLLKFIFGKEGIDFAPENFEGQTGVVFSPEELYETSSIVYKSIQGEKTFKILGGFDTAGKKFIESEEVIKLGQLPSREVLLSQLVGMVSAPIRMLAYVLNEKSKQNQTQQ
jgi:large subunit ribosomal protein L10